MYSATKEKEIHLTIPMVKDDEEDQSSAFAVLDYAAPIKHIKLQAFSCADGEAAQVNQIPHSVMQVCRFDTSKMT